MIVESYEERENESAKFWAGVLNSLRNLEVGGGKRMYWSDRGL